MTGKPFLETNQQVNEVLIKAFFFLLLLLVLIEQGISRLLSFFGSLVRVDDGTHHAR